ncbi:DUF7006 family protein [Enterococcus sp. AZ152]|uniref:DUF7006 family protein n=1 Tax=Enterococcus sp. AZ152 TaxID=2774848 RepID=UPI003F25E44C
MKEYCNFLSEEEYFRYFENFYNDPIFVQKYPLISNRLKENCQLIKEKIQSKSTNDFFKLHAEIMGLDAQLQILLQFVDFVQENSECSEELALDCSKKDYLVFMKELCGHDEISKHSLYFSTL